MREQSDAPPESVTAGNGSSGETPEAFLLQAHLHEVHAILRKQSKENLDLKTRVTKAEGELTVLREELRRSRDETGRLHEELGRKTASHHSELDRRDAAHQRELAELEEQRAQVTELDKMKEQCTLLAMQTSQSADELERAGKTLNAKLAELDTVKEQCTLLAKQKDELERTCRLLSEQKVVQEREFQEITSAQEREFQELSSKLETNVLELRQAHAERQKSWEETLTLREMELAQARVREEEALKRLQQAKEESDNAKEESDKAIEDADVSLREKDKALRQLADEKSAIKAQLGKTSRELKEEMEKNSKLENQIKERHEAANHVIILRGEISRLKEMNEALLRSLERSVHQDALAAIEAQNKVQIRAMQEERDEALLLLEQSHVLDEPSQTPGVQVSPRLRRQQVATASNIESRGKCGIGVVLEPNHRLGHLQVLELTPHGPAARSGLISAGDLIMQVDGELIESMQDAMDKLLGPEKSVVELVVRKWVTGLMQEIHLVRDRIPVRAGTANGGQSSLPETGDTGVADDWADVRTSKSHTMLADDVEDGSLPARQAAAASSGTGRVGIQVQPSSAPARPLSPKSPQLFRASAEQATSVDWAKHTSLKGSFDDFNSRLKRAPPPTVRLPLD